MSDVIRLAIAEDHELVRQGLSALIDTEDDLELAIEVSNGEELLNSLKKTAVDIILLDIEMPVLNGIDTLVELNSRHPELKVIMLSMHDEKEFISECISYGARGFLPKNCDFEEVCEAIRAVYNDGFYFDDRISVMMISDLVNKDKNGDSAVTLSDREIEIIRLVCKGLKNREIAESLYLSKRTIENHRRRIGSKTGTKTTVDLVVFAIKNGIYELDES